METLPVPALLHQLEDLIDELDERRRDPRLTGHERQRLLALESELDGYAVAARHIASSGAPDATIEGLLRSAFALLELRLADPA
jgi:hypothetical protein